MTRHKRNIAKTAFGFVLVIGVVNLFADMAYEGGRSIAGPCMGSLGASATIVGFVAGFGELLGYSLRSVSGYFADTERGLAYCWFQRFSVWLRLSSRDSGIHALTNSRQTQPMFQR